MANFAKKLEEATDEELRSWINNLDFLVVPLASDELTRRALDKLQKSIEKADQSTTRFNKLTFLFSLAVIFLTLVQIAIALIPIIQDPWGVVAIFLSIVLLMRLIFARIYQDIQK